MHVYQAINEVQAVMAKEGISKDRRNTQGAGYNFRGVDDVMNALAGHLAEAKLMVLPRAVSRIQEERQSKSGGSLFYTTILMEYDFVSAVDGSKHTVSMYGEAMDSGDKSSNKAASAAFKYACFQAFCIPTEGDNDADAHTHEVARKVRAESKPTVVHTPISDDSLNQLNALCLDERLDAIAKDQMKTKGIPSFSALNDADAQKFIKWLEGKK